MAPEISFYILPDELTEEPQQARGQFACRLAEKAWRNGVTSHIHLASRDDLKDLDQLLWSFREDSFLPHAVVTDSTLTQEPVSLGISDTSFINREGLLINLGNEIPADLSSFSRVAEIVVQDEKILKLARVRFRQYRERGLTPKHQKVGKPA